MRGKKTSPEKVEEVKALSLVYSPDVISAKLAIPVRTVYDILKQTDSPAIEAKREEKRAEIVDKVWADKEGEILKLKPETRVVPINGYLIGDLGSYIAQEGLRGTDKLFSITRQRGFQIVKDVCYKAGIDRDRAHPHTFRHSFAVHCVLNGVPLPVLKKWLGYSSISRTMIYCQVLARDTRGFYEAINF